MVDISGIGPNTNVPAIQEPLADVGSLAQVVKALRQGLQSLAGARGNIIDRAVTFADLVGLRLISGASLQGGTIVVSAPDIFRAMSFWPGTMVVNQVIHRINFVDDVIIPQGLSGSAATAANGSLVLAVVTIKVAQGLNAPNIFTTVGTITFTHSPTAILALSATLIMAPGDVMQLVCTTADAALRDMSATIIGTIV